MFLKFTKSSLSSGSGTGSSAEANTSSTPSTAENLGSDVNSTASKRKFSSALINSNSNGSALLEGSLSQQFEVGKLTASGGPGNIWKIYEGYRKSDAQEVSVFIYEKKLTDKLHKPRKRDTVTELLRNGIRQLERFRHPRLLQIIAGPEETNDTLSFYSEPIYGSLANIVIPVDEKEKEKEKTLTSKDYHFLEVELKYGILQLSESLSFLHNTCNVVHRNVTPYSIFVTKKGTWKMAGLEFTESFEGKDGSDNMTIQQWNPKASKYTQPDLDYNAPEVQLQSQCNPLSDMFSLGLVICSIFNNGKSLIDANFSASTYSKQIEQVEEKSKSLMTKIPAGLTETVIRLVNKDGRQRPSSQIMSLIKFFSDPVVNCLQFLDVIDMKDPSQKTHFYRTTLVETLPLIPRKLWFLHVWPTLQLETRTQDALAAALQPILQLITEISNEEYENIVLPHFRSVFTIPKSIQATITLLENMDIILQKTPEEDIETDILPIIYAGLESNTLQVQVAAIKAATCASESLDVEEIKKRLLPRSKNVIENNSTDVSLLLIVFSCYERIIDKIERATVIDEILPILYDIKIQDPEVMVKVINIYRLMLSEKKFGLSVNQLANRVLPSIIPLTVCPTLHLEQFNFLMYTIQEMLEMIDRHQKSKLKLGNLNLSSPSTGEKRMLRHQLSSDSMNLSPYGVVPHVRIQDSKMYASAEDFLSRRSSAGLGYLGISRSGPSSPDSNMLRVQTSYIGRRLSDNELMMPPKIRIAHSSASSPGDTNTGSLPIRRHSSICSERRLSTSVNLSPPTLCRSMVSEGYYRRSFCSPSRRYLSSPPLYFSLQGGANSSRSVPMLLTPGGGSNASSRRQSACSIGSFGGFDSRRSSIASIGSPLGTQTFKTSRRPSAFVPDSSNPNLLQQLSSGMCSLFSGK